MNKKIVIGIMLVLSASPFFCAGLKKGKVEVNSNDPNGEIEDYINYIRKGCDLIDLDCLYEIVYEKYRNK